jgi:signal peptidase I
MVGLLAFRSAVADWNDVPTGSMRPTILEGDRIFVNKLAYDLRVPFTRERIACWAEPSRGDIVVFYSPEDGKRLVKRIVGVPGDTVSLDGGRLVVNGTVARYGLVAGPHRDILDGEVRVSETIWGNTHAITLMPRVPAPRWFGPTVVPEGRYFLMGDNRDNSADSRFFGFVPRSAIAGKAPAVVASCDRRNWFLPRLDRFLVRLV